MQDGGLGSSLTLLKGSALWALLDGAASEVATMTRPPSPEVLLRLTAVRPGRWFEPPAILETRLDVFSLADSSCQSAAGRCDLR